MRQKGYYLLVFVAAAMLVIGVSAWAKIYTLQATSIAPGATGTVDAKTAKAGQNIDVTLKVDHLAKPTLLTPPANNYVVWLQSERGGNRKTKVSCMSGITKKAISR